MSELKHTPTPWTYVGNGPEQWVVYTNQTRIANVLTPEADAEFIVRAVNSHEALITAVQAAIIHISNDKVKEALQNILNRAEGEAL